MDQWVVLTVSYTLQDSIQALVVNMIPVFDNRAWITNINTDQRRVFMDQVEKSLLELAPIDAVILEFERYKPIVVPNASDEGF